MNQQATAQQSGSRLVLDPSLLQALWQMCLTDYVYTYESQVELVPVYVVLWIENVKIKLKQYVFDKPGPRGMEQTCGNIRTS